MPRTRVTIPNVAEAGPGLWSNCIRAGDLLFISGQVARPLEGGRTLVGEQRVRAGEADLHAHQVDLRRRRRQPRRCRQADHLHGQYQEQHRGLARAPRVLHRRFSGVYPGGSAIAGRPGNAGRDRSGRVSRKVVIRRNHVYGQDPTHDQTPAPALRRRGDRHRSDAARYRAKTSARSGTRSTSTRSSSSATRLSTTSRRSRSAATSASSRR